MKQARWEELRTMMGQSLEKALQPGSGAPPATVVCLQTFLGASNAQTERHAEAVDLLEKAVALSTRELGAEHYSTLTARFQLAAAYSRQGRYDLTLPQYRALLPLYEKRFGPNALDTANVLRNISIALHWLGNYQDSLGNDLRVLQIMSGLAVGPGSCDSMQACTGMVGQANQNVADTLRRLGRAAEALPYAVKGVELQRQAKGASHPQTLDAQLVRASVLHGLGRNEEAREMERLTLLVARQVHGEGHPITRKAAGNYAASSRTPAQAQEANEIDAARLKVQREKLGPQHPDVLLTTVNLVERHMGLGQLQQALAEAEPAVAAMVSRTDTLMFDDRTLDAWTRLQARLVNAYTYLLIRNGRQADAFMAVEFFKHRKLSLALDGQAAGDAEVQRQIKVSARKLGLLDQRIALARSLGRDINQLNGERSVEFMRWKALADRSPAQIPSLKAPPQWARKLLAQGEVVVSYRYMGNTLVAFVVMPGSALIYDLDDRGRTGPSVEAYRLAMRHLALNAGKPGARPPPVWRLANGGFRYAEEPPSPDARPVANLQDILGSLSATLLSQVLPKIGPQKRLLISIDQNLGHVPFDALPLEGGGVLGDRFTVAMLPSFALFDTLSARQAGYAQLPRQALLAVGGAHYAKSERISPFITLRRERESTATDMDAKVVWQAVQRDRSKLPLAFAQFAAGQADLPGSKAEVETIARSFDAAGHPATVLAGDSASEESINRLAESGQLERFRMLHFSTHGYLSDDEPGLSAIVLSQVNRAAGTDGYLTSAELSTMSLQSDLVVVSACDSGASDKVSGEGAAGLSFALFQAGTVASLLTLWPVEDQDSRRFMERFYAELLRGASTPLALQITKSWARGAGISAHVTQGFVMWGI